MTIYPIVIIQLLLLTYGWGLVDVNQNGTSDVWEKKYGVGAVDMYADPDNDGVDTVDESLSGTDPFDGNSVLSVQIGPLYVNAMLLEWQTKQGVKYRIQESESLFGGWTDLGDAVIGNGNSISLVVDKTSDRQNYYRIQIIGSNRFLDLPVGVAMGGAPPDFDEDGINDLVEIRAGINPLSNMSSLPVLSVASGSGRQVIWNTEPGKVYQVQHAGNENGPWQDAGALHYGTGEDASAGVPSVAGVVGHVRVVVSDVDTDEDGVTDWEELSVGLSVNRDKTDVLGQGDLQKITSLLAGSSKVSVKSGKAVANISQMQGGSFTIERDGGGDELTVQYTISGTAMPGSDYTALSGEAIIPFGHNSIDIEVSPLAGSNIGLSESVILTLTETDDYDLGDDVSRQINIIKEVQINVKDYGAVGDGVSDDTTSIQNAIAALESSTTHNTLFFPSGNYRLDTYTYTSLTMGTSWNRLLQFGKDHDLAGRDLIFRGESGATLYSTVSPVRAKMLLVLAKFRSLRFVDLSWEKDDVALEPKISVEPNGAPGVAFWRIDDRVIEFVEFDRCKFENCHRAVAFDVPPYESKGKIRRVIFESCDLFNPYGANTINSQLSYGGGTQVYMTPWIGLAEYYRNTFTGGTDAMNDTNAPGGRLKDGGHFGTPNKLVFRGNTVLNMGVEALYQENRNNYIGGVAVPFVMPPPDDNTEVEVTLKLAPVSVESGMIIAIRSGGTSNVFRVVSIDVSNKKLMVTNVGNPISVPSGTTVSGHVYLQIADPPIAIIENNYFNGCVSSGIVSTARSTIRYNYVVDCGIGINIYDDVFSPVYRGSRGSVIDSNFVFTRDPDISNNYTMGILSWASDAMISRNRVMTPRSRRFCGILTQSSGATIRENRVGTQQIIVNGYSSPIRAVGVAHGNSISSASYISNHTQGMDIGVGGLQAYTAQPHTVVDHHSQDDQVPVDWWGLIEN